jgi:hypothetical protein
MGKARPLFLTAAAQLGYAAILLQAFAIPPPLQSFRPCGCTIVAPQNIRRLILFDQLPSSQSGNKADIISKNSQSDKFCPRALSATAPPMLENLYLDGRLEQLLFKHSAQVALCLTLDPQGNVKSATTRSVALGAPDQRLIAEYVTANWKFTPRGGASSALDRGPHRMTLAVHQDLVW